MEEFKELGKDDLTEIEQKVNDILEHMIREGIHILTVERTDLDNKSQGSTYLTLEISTEKPLIVNGEIL